MFEASDYSPEKGEGMGLVQWNRVLEEIRWETPWRKDADRACDYYDSNQLDSESLRRMKERGIAPSVFNIIAPVIDVSLGLEARNRTDGRVTEENDESQHVAIALNERFNEAERKSHADRACSDAYASQLKAGLGWVEVARESNPYEPKYRVNHVHRREIHWDWRDLKPHLPDARYLVRSRWVDEDVAIAMLPEHREIIRGAYTMWTGYTDLDLNTDQATDLAEREDQERVFTMPDFEWRLADRRRVRFFEVWYRLWHRGLLLFLKNGRIVEFNKKNKHQIAAIAQGLVRVEERVYPRMRFAMWMGPHKIFDVPSPYRHQRFPYIPFWGYREDLTGVPYGLIRRMISPQDEVNARRSKALWTLSAKRLIADSDAIDYSANTKQEVFEELTRPDAAIFLNPHRTNRDADAFRVDQDFVLAKEQMLLYDDAREMVNKVAGVYQTMLGDTKGQAKSGVGINQLIEQGITTLAEINDNYQFARKLVFEMLLDLVKEDMSQGEQEVRIGEGAARYSIILNRQVTDEMGEVQIVDDVSSSQIKVVIEEVPSTPAARQQEFMMLTELVKGLPGQIQGVVIDFVIGASSLKDRKKMAERIRKQLGIPEDVPPDQQAQVDEANRAQAAEVAELQKRAAMAEISKTEAEAHRAQAQAEATSAQAQSAEAGAQSQMDAVKSAMERAQIANQEAMLAISGELERERLRGDSLEQQLKQRAQEAKEGGKPKAEPQAESKKRTLRLVGPDGQAYALQRETVNGEDRISINRAA